MKCFTCKSTMECVDDINVETCRIDWFKCPKCNSRAEVNYGGGGEYIKEVKWIREQECSEESQSRWEVFVDIIDNRVYYIPRKLKK